METSRIYWIECNKDAKTGYYIGLTKRKIMERIYKHKGDIYNNIENTAIAEIIVTEYNISTEIIFIPRSLHILTTDIMHILYGSSWNHIQ